MRSSSASPRGSRGDGPPTTVAPRSRLGGAGSAGSPRRQSVGHRLDIRRPDRQRLLPERRGKLPPRMSTRMPRSGMRRTSPPSGRHLPRGQRPCAGHRHHVFVIDVDKVHLACQSLRRRESDTALRPLEPTSSSVRETALPALSSACSLLMDAQDLRCEHQRVIAAVRATGWWCSAACAILHDGTGYWRWYAVRRSTRTVPVTDRPYPIGRHDQH